MVKKGQVVVIYDATTKAHGYSPKASYILTSLYCCHLGIICSILREDGVVIQKNVNLTLLEIANIHCFLERKPTFRVLIYI